MSGLKQSRKSSDPELSVNFIRKEVMLSCGKRNWMVYGTQHTLGFGKCHQSLRGGGARNLLEFWSRNISCLPFFSVLSFPKFFFPLPLQAICQDRPRARVTLLLLLSHFSRVRLCETPQAAAHQAPPSLGFSRQEHWSGLPFPSPVHESEK